MSKSFQVVGIGNAIIDILSYVDDSFLKKNSIKKMHCPPLKKIFMNHIYKYMFVVIKKLV